MKRRVEQVDDDDDEGWKGRKRGDVRWRWFGLKLWICWQFVYKDVSKLSECVNECVRPSEWPIDEPVSNKNLQKCGFLIVKLEIFIRNITNPMVVLFISCICEVACWKCDKNIKKEIKKIYINVVLRSKHFIRGI